MDLKDFSFDSKTLGDIVRKMDDGMRYLTSSASAIAGQIASARPENIQQIIAQISGLSDQASRMNIQVPSIAALLQSAQAKFDQLLEDELETQKAMAAAVGGGGASEKTYSPAYEKAMYERMTGAEKTYFDRIKANENHEAFTYNEETKQLEKSDRIISGKEVRESFLDIKEHTPGNDPKLDKLTGKPVKAEEETPDKTLKDMKRLHGSLDDVEAHHMGELNKKRGRRSERDVNEEAKEHHGRFRRAHDHVQAVESAAHDCQEAKRKGYHTKDHDLRVKKAKAELGTVLQEEVINQTLTKDIEQESREKGAPEVVQKFGREADVKWSAETAFTPPAPNNAVAAAKTQNTGQNLIS